jgi:amino acid permease
MIICGMLILFRAFGPWGKRVVNFILLLSIYVSVIAYLVLQGDILPSIMMFITSNSLGAWWSSRAFLMGILSAVLIPISSAQSLKTLRFTSLISLISIYFLAVVIVVKCVQANVCFRSFDFFSECFSYTPLMSKLYRIFILMDPF